MDAGALCGSREVRHRALPQRRRRRERSARAIERRPGAADGPDLSGSAPKEQNMGAPLRLASGHGGLQATKRPVRLRPLPHQPARHLPPVRAQHGQGSGPAKSTFEASKWQRYRSKMRATGSHSTGKGILFRDRSHFAHCCVGKLGHRATMPSACRLALNKMASNLEGGFSRS
jgi:hypothetical protein